MITKKQIATMAAPFLEQHPDFAWTRNYYLIQTPFSAHIKGFCFDRSSMPNSTYIYYFSSPTYFEPTSGISLAFGKRMQKELGQVWIADEASSLALLPIRMSEKWDWLSKIDTVTAFFDYVSSREVVGLGWSIANPAVRGPICAALGRWSEAISALEVAVAYDAKRHDYANREPVFKKSCQDRALLLKTLQENPSGVYDLLHQWEAETVKNLGLEEHWRPMRFPGESTPPHERN